MTRPPPESLLESPSGIHDGRVESVSANGELAVALAAGHVRASIAVPGLAPRSGDAVLVATNASGQHFVIGVLAAERAVTRVVTNAGIEARVDQIEDGEVLQVRDRDGAVLFEHRRVRGATVLSVPGDLELRAGGSVRIVAGDKVEVSARQAGVKIADEARLEAGSISTVAQKALAVIGLIETRAGRILERAKTVYRDVEDLSQTRAGRIRMVAEKTFHTMADRLHLKAKQDVKVKSDKIYLG